MLKILTDTSQPMTASMFRDLSQGLPVGADHIVGDMVRRAATLGVDATYLGIGARIAKNSSVPVGFSHRFDRIAWCCLNRGGAYGQSARQARPVPTDRSKTMKIALIGITGRVGSRVADELLKRGHQVTGIARNLGDVNPSPA